MTLHIPRVFEPAFKPILDDAFEHVTKELTDPPTARAFTGGVLTGHVPIRECHQAAAYWIYSRLLARDASHPNPLQPPYSIQDVLHARQDVQAALAAHGKTFRSDKKNEGPGFYPTAPYYSAACQTLTADEGTALQTHAPLEGDLVRAYITLAPGSTSEPHQAFVDLSLALEREGVPCRLKVHTPAMAATEQHNIVAYIPGAYAARAASVMETYLNENPVGRGHAPGAVPGKAPGLAWAHQPDERELAWAHTVSSAPDSTHSMLVAIQLAPRVFERFAKLWREKAKRVEGKSRQKAEANARFFAAGAKTMAANNDNAQHALKL